MASSKEGTCRFLDLPLELRLHIYSYVLPHTISAEPDLVNTLRSTPSTTDNSGSTLSNNNGHAPLQRSNSMTSLLKTLKAAPVSCALWCRGHTSILAVNHQIHSEAAGLLYGDNFFSLTIAYDRIKFHFAWQLESGLQPRQSFEFFQWFSNANIRRMRNFMITIEHVDSYTSTIKYNCGGAGLAAGLKGQADKLVRVIKRQHGVSATPPLRYVKIMLSDEMKKRKMAAGEDANKEALARIVEPFGKLRAQTAKITDVVGADVARTLEKAMTSDVPDVTRDVKSAHEQYPDVVKEEVKDRMKKWAAWKEPISPAGYYTMAAARLTGFSEI